VSDGGITTDPDKVSVVKNWPAIKNVKDLRMFLGFTSYYRRFIQDYAKIVKPLIGHTTNKRKTKVKSKKVPTKWSWNEDQQKAMDRVIEKLTSPPILAYADYTLPFILHTDASNEGLGAVLYQKQGGIDRVIAYASRRLRGAERLYPAHKRELLALKWAVADKFHEYLYGSKFEVKTDNNPLTYIFDKAKLDAVGHRWVASLSNYNFNLTYRAGKANGDADPLSIIQPETKQMFHNAIKAVCSACVISASNPCIETVLLTQNVNIDDSLVSDVDISAIDWHEEQNADPDIRRVKTLFSDWAQTYKKENIFRIGRST
jgi:hypothetical protein